MAGFVHILPKFGLTIQHFLECVIPNLYDFSFFSEVNISVYFFVSTKVNVLDPTDFHCLKNSVILVFILVLLIFRISFYFYIFLNFFNTKLCVFYISLYGF